MDDLLKNNEETGAGMIGDTDYNSCCYYECALPVLMKERTSAIHNFS
jgi:hypothetical protein